MKENLRTCILHDLASEFIKHRPLICINHIPPLHKLRLVVQDSHVTQQYGPFSPSGDGARGTCPSFTPFVDNALSENVIQIAPAMGLYQVFRYEITQKVMVYCTTDYVVVEVSQGLQEQRNFPSCLLLEWQQS